MTAISDELSASAAIGRFVAGFRAEDLPQPVLHEAKRSLLNFLGCAIGVAYHPVVETAVRVYEPFSASRTGTLIGRHERLDPLSASFVNAVSANLLDYDDTHLRTVIHPTAPVAPPALAIAETRGLPGAAVLTAFALGAEIECRLGNMVTGGHYARGWHITATCGVFGAAVACARLLGLSAAKTADALGIAASQAAGVAENLPTEAKNVGVGNAARGGLLAALFAEAGYDAAPGAIEGRQGWARAAGDQPALGELYDDLGQRWELLKNTYKPYPCGIVMHSIIDACLDLRQRYALDPEAIERVVVYGDALMQARGDRLVRNARDARVSNHHSAASALLWGRAGVSEFTDPKAMSAEAVAFRTRVSSVLDASQPQGAARVVVHLKGGETHEATVLAARGSLSNPLSDAELEEKVRQAIAEAGTGLDAGRVAANVWAMDKASDVNAMLAATVVRKV